MPANTVYVGRPSRWGNPWGVGDGDKNDKSQDGNLSWREGVKTPEEAVVKFRKELIKNLAKYDSSVDCLLELRGKSLCCWCPLDKPCHADVLLELANK